MRHEIDARSAPAAEAAVVRLTPQLQPGDEIVLRCDHCKGEIKTVVAPESGPWDVDYSGYAVHQNCGASTPDPELGGDTPEARAAEPSVAAASPPSGIEEGL